ncbi:MAG: AbrB/MazE/SpoVT family DNA-binding domain-containing protein [Oceanipulchritudo sp.]
MLKKLSSKGQLVLPAGYRRKMGLAEGSPIRIREDGNRLILEPARPGKATFIHVAGCARPILSMGAQRVIADRDLVDPLDDDV